MGEAVPSTTRGCVGRAWHADGDSPGMARPAEPYDALAAGPFRWADVAAAVPRHGVRSRAVRRVTRGVYLPAAMADDFVSRCRALNLVLPSGAAYSHATAGRLLGVQLPSLPRLHLDDLHVTTPAGVEPPRRTGVRAYERSLPEEHTQRLIGVAVTTPGRTFLDLAQVVDLAHLVAVGDQLVRHFARASEDIAEVLEWARGRPGVPRARQAAGLLSAGAESPPESIARVHLHLGGLPQPEVNGWITDPQGDPRYRGDLVYRAWRTVVEYDGAYHRDAEQFGRDLARRNDLTAWGWTVVHLDASLLRRPDRLVAAVRAALHANGWR